MTTPSNPSLPKREREGEGKGSDWWVLLVKWWGMIWYRMGKVGVGFLGRPGKGRRKRESGGVVEKRKSGVFSEGWEGKK